MELQQPKVLVRLHQAEATKGKNVMVGEANPVGVLDRQPTKGVPEVDECGLAEIGNSKEETHGT
jgi:hypothetical protein